MITNWTCNGFKRNVCVCVCLNECECHRMRMKNPKTLKDIPKPMQSEEKRIHCFVNWWGLSSLSLWNEINFNFKWKSDKKNQTSSMLKSILYSLILASYYVESAFISFARCLLIRRHTERDRDRMWTSNRFVCSSVRLSNRPEWHAKQTHGFVL